MGEEKKPPDEEYLVVAQALREELERLRKEVVERILDLEKRVQKLEEELKPDRRK